MNSMSKCRSCDGLVPARQVMCPHCDAPVPVKRRSKFIAALSVASAGVASMTLMACYGIPAAPCDYAADGGTQHNGMTCQGVCVDPASTAAAHCYDYQPADAGTGDAGTDAGTQTDAGARDGG